MKRLYVILSAVCIYSLAFSQESNWNAKGFESQVRVSFDEGVDYQKNFSFGADYIAAYRFNEIVRLGAGIGIDYVKLRFEESTFISKYYEAYYESAMAIPLFVNVKVDFMKRRVSPYMSAECGYNIFVPFSEYAKGNKLGFFVSPSLGIDIRFRKCTLFVELAYKYQCRDFSKYGEEYGNYHQLSQSIGVAF